MLPGLQPIDSECLIGSNMFASTASYFALHFCLNKIIILNLNLSNIHYYASVYVFPDCNTLKINWDYKYSSYSSLLHLAKITLLIQT